MNRLLLLLVLALPAMLLLPAQAQSTSTGNQNETKKQPEPAKQPEKAPADKAEPKDDKPTKPERSKIAITPPPSSSQLIVSDLKHYLDNKTLQPLLSGGEDFLTLFASGNSANNKGVAIILPEWQQSATDPKASNILRQTLPDLGWTTMVIQPPDRPNGYPSHSLDQTSRDEQNMQLIEQYQNKLNAMMQMVMDKASDYPGIFLVIAEGNNAALLLDLYQQKRVKPATALVMLSSHRELAADNLKLAEQIGDSQLPILDLYLNHDNQQTQAYAKQRRTEAKKKLKVFYRQKQLETMSAGYYPQQTLLQEINGWLKSIGW